MSSRIALCLLALLPTVFSCQTTTVPDPACASTPPPDATFPINGRWALTLEIEAALPASGCLTIAGGRVTAYDAGCETPRLITDSGNAISDDSAISVTFGIRFVYDGQTETGTLHLMGQVQPSGIVLGDAILMGKGYNWLGTFTMSELPPTPSFD